MRWAEYAEAVDAETAARLRRTASRGRREADSVLTQARTAREDLHRAVTHPSDARAVARVSAVAREAAAHGGLVADASGVFRWELGRSAGLARPLLAVARAAEEFLTGGDVAFVKACPGHECGWLFVDRRGRRRWCSMADCGNRAKVAAHAARHR